MAQVTGFLPSTWETLTEAWLWPSPAQAMVIVDIWGVNQWMGALSN